jgi:hypothetical protein
MVSFLDNFLQLSAIELEVFRFLNILSCFFIIG